MTLPKLVVANFMAKCTNSNSLSIEICDDVKNNAIYPTEATINNVVELVRTLMKKYNIDISNVIRHFDVTGKKCPMYWCEIVRKMQYGLV